MTANIFETIIIVLFNNLCNLHIRFILNSRVLFDMMEVFFLCFVTIFMGKGHHEI